MPSEHAKLSPSKAERWFKCPGSIRMSELVPEPETSEYAAEGTVAHAAAERCLWENLDAVEIPEDDTYNDEMAECIQLYLDVVREAGEQQPDSTLLVEHRFKITDDVWGTNDACVFKDHGKMTIFDLKYGRGVQVDVEDNPQLMIYLLGAAQETDCWEFEICIVQPRGYHPDGKVRRLTVTPAMIQAFHYELDNNVEKTQDPNAYLHAGEHCRWCPVAGQCPEQAKEALTQFEPVVVGPEMELMSAEQLGSILTRSKELKTWLEALEKWGKKLLLEGMNVPGMKLVHSSGHRKFREDRDIEALAVSQNVDCFTEPKQISPAEFEKRLGKKGVKPKERKEILDGYTMTPSTQALVIESDKRPAIRNADEQFKSNEANEKEIAL